MKVKIGKLDRDKIEAFADARLGSSDLYKKRGGFKRDDLVAGAMGEVAVYNLLVQHGHELRKPDFEIYEKGKKSFDADLRVDNKFLHVKSQTKQSADRYGRSWLMQRHDPILKKAGYKHYLVTTVVDLDKNEVEVLGFFPLYSILKKGLVGECKVPSFRMTKVAIYHDTLDSAITKSQRWRVLK